METDEQSSTSRRRLRFSILNILLAIALVACGITIWQLWREVGPLRSEVSQLRNETGRLSVEDPTKIHAIEVRTSEPCSGNGVCGYLKDAPSWPVTAGEIILHPARRPQV